jgi:hypothetical protein
MIIENIKLCNELGKIYTRELCISFFTSKNVKEYYDLLFSSYAKGNMQTYLNIVNINIKIKLLKYLRKNIQKIIIGLNIDYDKFNSPTLDLNDIKLNLEFTKEICDGLFIEESERVWNLFLYKNTNFVDFLKYINILDKLIIFTWLQFESEKQLI